MCSNQITLKDQRWDVSACSVCLGTEASVLRNNVLQSCDRGFSR